MSPPIPRPALFLIAALSLAGPARAEAEVSACRYVEVAKVPLRYTGPGLDITMDGAIDGTPAQVMIDTGASETYLTRTGTEKRGLVLGPTGQYRTGIGGSSRVYSARLKEFSAGPARSNKGRYAVIGDTGFVPSYDAIVGAPFLLQTDLEISLAEKMLKFFRPDGCKDRFLAYWDPDAVEIPFEFSGERSPNPHFTVLLNGQKFDAVIDSGATASFITLRAAKRAGLKLDAPGVTRMNDVGGIGDARVARWRTVFDTFSIGNETVKNAEIGVMEPEGDLNVDILLGADFLRAHRVLFAMSQKKIYLSYVGGDPFGQRRKLEPWLQREADGGNPDAQFALANIYQAGVGVEKDPKQASAWLEKAAALGQPQAGLLTGRRLMLAGKPAEAAQRLRAALDKLPAERYGALWLHVARVNAGEAELAKTELEATFARSSDDEWPKPIADFFLGRIDAPALMDQAGKDAKLSHVRTCQATAAMAEWHAGHGDKAKANSLMASVRAHCAPAAKPQAAVTAAPQAAAGANP